MLKGWVTVVIVVILALGGGLLIKSANAVCGHEFTRVGICGHIPAISSLSENSRQRNAVDSARHLTGLKTSVEGAHSMGR